MAAPGLCCERRLVGVLILERAGEKMHTVRRTHSHEPGQRQQSWEASRCGGIDFAGEAARMLLSAAQYGSTQCCMGSRGVTGR